MAQTMKAQVFYEAEKMTLEEKIGQLNLYSNTFDITGPSPPGDWCPFRWGMRHESHGGFFFGPTPDPGLNVVEDDAEFASEIEAATPPAHGAPAEVARPVVVAGEVVQDRYVERVARKSGPAISATTR